MFSTFTDGFTDDYLSLKKHIISGFVDSYPSLINFVMLVMLVSHLVI